ncbi:MAG: MFS transporter [Oscillospiraceae bacterium]|nr:MFS transporter [Oscillospiraceae bacterium]
MKDERLFTRDFTMVIIGQIISLFGNAVLRFALPLYLLREMDSSVLFGTVSACSFIPMVIFSLFGGIIADRVNKRNIMVTLDFCTAALIIFFGLSLEKLPLVPLITATLMILYGISGAYQPSVQASIPLLVNGKYLMQGNAAINMVSTLSGLLGPVIGGVLYGSFGIAPVLTVSVICFTISAVMEIFIRIPYVKATENISVFGAVSNDLRESYSFVRNEKPVFISVVLLLALFNLVLSAAMVVGIPVIAVKFLGMSDAALGIVQGAMGLGGLAGGILAGVFAKKMKLRDSHITLVICSFAAFFMGISLFNSIPHIVAFAIINVMCFAAMCASTMFSVAMLTVVQQQTPPQLLGKIMSAIMAVSGCSHPLGQAAYGVLFYVFEEKPYIVMLGSAVFSLIIALYSRKIFVKLEGQGSSL